VRTLWAAVATVERWDSGNIRLAGMHQRFLLLWERALATHRSNPLSEIHEQAIPCFCSIGSESRFTNVILPKAIYRRARGCNDDKDYSEPSPKDQKSDGHFTAGIRAVSLGKVLKIESLGSWSCSSLWYASSNPRTVGEALTTPSFRAALENPRTVDPMFLLYRLLRPLHVVRSADKGK
jgi:hypothetical protein